MQHIGSRWWKFDFHTHTPASMDYGKADHQIKATMTAQQWLMDYINKGIECIAVTDHNSGKWIDCLKEEAKNLREAGYTIYIFPGIEITTHGNIHILGIFDIDKDSAYISQVIGAVKYFGTDGDSDAVTQLSPEQVIHTILDFKGVAIPAHIDKASGLCTVHKSGSTLRQILEKASAVEIIKSHNDYELQLLNSSPLTGYVGLNSGLSEVLGSDSHHPKTVGRAFTWIKMGSPSIEGLRLALLDGEDSILRSDIDSTSPNIYAENRITSIKINKTKYCGRLNEFSINLHPWLNCIIGGRGSGKSSILEFMRTGLERKNELAQLSSNQDLFKSYTNLTKKAKSRDEDGVFLDDTKIEINYLKEETEYLLTWEYNTKKSKISRRDGDNLIEEEGDVVSRFPVKIFSQKQIFEISKSPNYLLKIIDESDIVDFNQWSYHWNQEVTKYLNFKRTNRELRKNIADKGPLTGQLNDINQKITTIQKSSHAAILSGYNESINQENSISKHISSLSSNFKSLKDDIVLKKFDGFHDLGLFPNANDNNQNTFTATVKKLDAEIQKIIKEINNLIQNGDDKIKEFERWYANSDISNQIASNKLSYANLVASLQQSGVNNPAEYEQLINQRTEINSRLAKIILDEKQFDINKEASITCYHNMVELRKDLTKRRRDFLTSLDLDEKTIKLNIDFCSDTQYLESEFRTAIGKNDTTFSGDIYNEDDKGILNVLNKHILQKNENSDEVIKVIQQFKTPFFSKTNNQILGVTLSKRFSDHKNCLSDESVDIITTWFPNDSVSVKYLDGKRFKDISQGSAGQRAAAVLAFLLSNGNDPLILDQPEDDLDNQLIYDLIVKRIKESKKKRQIIIVTHNPNIVVNGDSELIISLNQQAGSTNLLCAGGLHEREIRNSICEIMEGGRAAFKQRYKRIFNA